MTSQSAFLEPSNGLYKVFVGSLYIVPCKDEIYISVGEVRFVGLVFKISIWFRRHIKGQNRENVTANVSFN